MKKYIAILMTLIMCLGVSNTVFASEQYVSEGTASSTVTYHADSSYIVIIPETVDANSTMKLTAASMNITSNEIVRVKVTNLNGSNCLELRNFYNGLATFYLHRTDTDAQIANNDDVATFTENCLEAPFGVNFTPESYEMSAGDYTGIITFSISLEDM